MPQYPVLNKGKLGPGWLEAGIPATNQGYKVMNAASPFDFSADDNWLRQFGQYMKRYLPGYDPEADEYRQKKANPLEGALPGGITGFPHEPNPWLTDEYNDKILRDLYPTEQEKMNKWIEDNNIGPEDLGMEPQLDVRSRGKWEYDNAVKGLLNKGLTIKEAIIELGPQWGYQPYKGFNYQMTANRGGLMSLV
jgi:hypothetical protein